LNPQNGEGVLPRVYRFNFGNWVKRGLLCLNISEALFDDRKKYFDALVKSLESPLRASEYGSACERALNRKGCLILDLKALK
jgi:hypothetical protein